MLTAKDTITLLLGILVGLVIMVVAAHSHDTSVPECYITGRIWESPIVEDAEIQLNPLAAGCEKLRFSHFEWLLVIESPKFRVEIEIPRPSRTNGWVEFAYVWGNSRAYIGVKVVTVTFSPREEGE